MNFLANIETWGNSHRPMLLDYVRIVLGAFVTYKGMTFMANIDQLQSLIGGYDLLFASVALAHYVVFVHIIGGALLVLGLFTRVMALLNVPVLIGAVFLVNYPSGFMSMGNHFELEISLLVLVGLLLFAVFGAGKLSIDQMRRREAELNSH